MLQEQTSSPEAPPAERDAGSPRAEAGPSPSELPHFRIQPSRGWIPLDLSELWAYRQLLFFLAWRDIKVRYKQTFLGAAWAVLVPVLTMVVFNVLFGLLLGSERKPTVPGVPYVISTYCALVPWQLFANAMTVGSQSLVANRNMITKVYFPRLIAPLAPILASLVDFTISFGLLIVIIAGYHSVGAYHFTPSWALLTLPLFILLAVLTAAAIALWLSAANAIYRDVQYIIPFLTQILLYVSPVVYTTESVLAKDGVPSWARLLYGLNPMAGVVEGFRWAVFGNAHPPWLTLVASAVMVVVVLIGGLFFFRRTERTFADLA